MNIISGIMIGILNILSVHICARIYGCLYMNLTNRSEHIGDISSYIGSYMDSHIWVTIYDRSYMNVRICAHLCLLVSGT